MPWVLWITGLPGCGKSTIALKVKEMFPDAVVLRMDDLRKIVTPVPTYSDEERELVYRSLVYTAKTLNETGQNVIIDATGNKRSWRLLARELIPDFIEVYLECPIDLCIEREKARLDTHSAPKKIYEKGKAGWPVPGINVPYEVPEAPELIIDTAKESPEKAGEKIVKILKNMQGQVSNLSNNNFREGNMKSYRKELWFNVPTRRAFINITSQVEECLRESKIKEGLCLVNAMHITASVFINDDESGLHQDYEAWLEKLAPHEPVSRYRHNHTGEDNGDAHLKRQIMGREVVAAVTDGKLDFGTWERIFYGEFDGMRKKRVLVKIIGE